VRAEWFGLRQQAGFYKSLHERACEREKALEREVEELQAKVRLRERELFGRKSERSQGLVSSQGALAIATGPRNPRGHRRGSPGHGRKSYAHLPFKEEWIDLPAEERRCDRCGLPFVSNGDSEDSEQVLLDKYAFLRPMGRLLADLATAGLELSAGTVTDGLRRIAPLFEPLMNGIVARNLKENQWHADETRWRVFEPVEGKVGKLLLVFCWQHVRRDFLDVARDGPAHEAWGFEWVAAIGELVHLNNLRLEVLDDAAAFAPRDAALRQGVERMAARRDAELAQGDLHPVRRKVLKSLQTHWDGLTLFVGHPELPMDNSAAERQMRGPALCRKIFYGSVAVWAGQLAAAFLPWNLSEARRR
jgi:transposase